MARIVPNLDFVALLPTKASLSNFLQMLRKVYTNLALTFNGKIGFGDGTNFDNISGTWANTTAPAAPNTDFTITHNLGRVPVGYWVMQKDRACDVYTGSVAATTTQLTLRATVASAVLRLFIVGILLFFASAAQAQTTSVTLQVTDLGGQAWNLGTWSVVLVSKQGAVPFGPPFNIPGSGPVPNQFQTGNFDATGTATMVLTQNSAIVPTQSQWRFTVCPQATSPCFDQAFIIANATQAVSPTPPAISVSCGAATKAYSDSEVLCQQGGFYYGLTLNQIRLCTSSVLPNTCLTWIGSAGTSGAGGIPIQVQVNSAGLIAGTPCQSLGNLTSGPINHDCDAAFKGPNPYVDSRRFGVRALTSANATPAISGITATATGGSPTVPVSTNVCNSQTGNVCFVNGDGVVIAGAGASNTLTVPQTVVVTSSNAQVGTQTGSVVNAPAGSTTYNYRIFACDVGGGCGPASTAISTTTGTASLGAQSQAGYSATRLNDTETFTVGSQPAFSAGTVVLVDTPTGSGDTDFMGFKFVATVTATGFTVTTVPLDTRNGARLASNGTYTIHWFNLNHVTWTAPAAGAPFRYFACSDRASPGTYHVIGPARLPVNPHNSSFTIGTLQFDDFGATMMAASVAVVPWYVSDANCSAAVASNDNWVTTILSGAQTTTLTMTGNAPNSSAGAVIRLDNTPNLKAAVSAACTGSNCPSVALPWDPALGLYVFNSVADLSANDPILLFPTGAVFNDTLILGGSAQLYGDVMVGKASSTGFQSKSVPFLSGASSPVVYVGGAGAATSVFAKGLGFAAPGNGIAFLQDGGGGNLGSTYTDDQFTTGFVSSTDYLGIPFACRGTLGGSCTGSWKGKNLFVSGNQNQAGLSNTSSFLCEECGSLVFDEIMANGRGFFTGFASDAGMTLRIGHSDAQGISTPFVTLSRKNSGNAGVQFWLGDAGQALLDTVAQSCFVYLPTSAGNLGIDFKYYGGCIPSAGVPRFSGQRITAPGITGAAPVQNRDTAGFTSGLAFDGIFATSGGNVLGYPIFQEQAAHDTGTLYPIFVQAPPMPAPTCSVSSGGSVSIGSHTYQVAPVWWNNGVDVPSQPSATCTTSTGNQTVTVTWTAIPGNPKGYEPYEDGISRQFTGGTCAAVPQVGPTVLSVVINADTACPLNVSQVPAGGPSMLMPGVQGIASPSITLSGSAPLTGVDPNPGAVVATGYQNSAYDNFNRANGAIGSNWTCNAGAYNITSNAIGPTGAGRNNCFWNLNVFGNAQFAQVTLTNPQNNGVSVNDTSNPWNAYTCTAGPTFLSLNKVTAGTYSVLTNVGTTNSAGAVLRLENNPSAGSNNLTCTINNSGTITTAQATDLTFAGGSVGLDGNAASGALDNWSGGNLHPIAQLDTEQDWTQPQHFLQPVTIGPTNPVAGALATNTLYTPNLVLNGNPFGPVYTTASASTNANITTTTMATAGANGNTYRFGFYFNETVAGTGCTTNTTVVVTLTYTDPNLSVVTNISIPSWTGTIVNNGNLGTLNQVLPTYARAKAGTTVSYSVAYTAGTCTTTPSYQVFPILEILN